MAAAVHLACQRPDALIPVPQVALPEPRIQPFLVNQEDQVFVKVPGSRFCASLISWLLSALGLVATVSESTVLRWFANHQIKPWQFRSWITPVCIDMFLERATPILDLYSRVHRMKDHEIAWSVDEKTSIQARARASYESSHLGEPVRLEATYKRAGVGQLYAGLDVGAGRIVADVIEGNEGKSFLHFGAFLLSLVDQSIARGKRVIHFVIDNSSIHRPRFLEDWLQENLRGRPGVTIIVHWLPVRSSWLNQIEIWFSILQAKVLTPNFLESFEEIRAAILGFALLYNQSAAPFKWTYTAQQLLNKYGRGGCDRIW